MKVLRTKHGITQALMNKQDLKRLRQNSGLKELRLGQLEKILPDYNSSQDILELVRQDSLVRPLLKTHYIVEVDSSCTWLVTFSKEFKSCIVSV